VKSGKAKRRSEVKRLKLYRIRLAKRYEKLYRTVEYVYRWFSEKDTGTTTDICKDYQPECRRASVYYYMINVLKQMKSVGLIENVGEGKKSIWHGNKITDKSIATLKWLMSNRGCSQCGEDVVLPINGKFCYKCMRERRKLQQRLNKRKAKGIKHD